METIFNERRYQIFISSTFADLEEERKKVLQAVLEMKSFPAGMELFPSANDEQWEFIKREIDSSDYYLLILAGKYGSLAIDGVSYTEKEYDYAFQAGKPIMAFLSKDIEELKGKFLEHDTERKDKLIAFHEKAKRSKLVRFFSSSEELKSSVLMSLVNGFRTNPQEGWVRAKNARRLEDLEEMTQLQKRVLYLEDENDKLQAMQTLELQSLAQGEDVATWEVILDSRRSGDAPPVRELSVAATWDTLFLSCFSVSLPVVTLKEVKKGLSQIVRKKLAMTYDSTDYITSFDNDDISSDSFQSILSKIRIQLLAFGYVTIEQTLQEHQQLGPISLASYFPPYKSENWILTHKGAVRLAMLSGDKRTPKPLS